MNFFFKKKTQKIRMNYKSPKIRKKNPEKNQKNCGSLFRKNPDLPTAPPPSPSPSTPPSETPTAPSSPTTTGLSSSQVGFMFIPAGKIDPGPRNNRKIDAGKIHPSPRNPKPSEPWNPNSPRRPFFFF
jgi:hypothetical protein